MSGYPTWELFFRTEKAGFLLRTCETLWNIDFELNVAEEHGQGHWEVALCPERDVPVAGLQVLEWKDPLTEHLAVVVVHSKAEHSQFRKDHLNGRERKEI